MSTAAVIIPFRDRGVDPLRQKNLVRVLAYWADFDHPVLVVDDGREGDAQFNRSAAYNRGAAMTDAEVLVYVESDTLIPHDQICQAIDMAAARPGLVVPFTRQKKLSEADSALVRRAAISPQDCTPVRHPYGEMTNYGCANVLNRRTLDAVGGFDEVFEGHGHDDSAMYQAFYIVAKPVRWVLGNAYHLYHLDVDPDTTPDRSYLSEEDIAAQERNRIRLALYQAAKTPEEIRLLTTGASTEAWVQKYWGRLNWRTRALVDQEETA